MKRKSHKTSSVKPLARRSINDHNLKLGGKNDGTWTQG
jgi:hypothetical protein